MSRSISIKSELKCNTKRNTFSALTAKDALNFKKKNVRDYVQHSVM